MMSHVASALVCCQVRNFDSRLQSDSFIPARMTTGIRVAVLGTGSLGKEHARLYAELARTGQINFVGVFDLNKDVCCKIAEAYRVHAFASVAEAARASDAL